MLAASAAAEPFYVNVHGVAADDTLNVRAAPDADRLKVLNAEMSNFSNDFMNIVKRHFF